MANPVTPAQKKLEKLKQNEGEAMAGACLRGFFLNVKIKHYRLPGVASLSARFAVA
jgi:hypothetical protein